MNYWKKILLIVFVLMPFSAIRGSIGDTILLEKVEAKGVRFGSYTIGAKVYRIDTSTLRTYQSGSLADLLQQQSFISVRTNGFGGLSTVSIRGGSSRNTAVIWNGINLRSPMSGEMNFSAVPTGFIDEITVQPGGSSTMYGNGAASGVIFLATNLHLDNSGWRTSLNTELGSFGSYSGMVATGFQGKRFASQIKAGYQHVENDFAFVNLDKFDDPIDTLKHAAFDRKSFSHQVSLKIGHHGLLETDLWYVNHFKKIPVLTFSSDSSESKAIQDDKNFRFALNLSTYRNRWFVRFRSGTIYDKIYYNDHMEFPIETINKSLSIINEAEGKYSLSRNHFFFLGLNHTFETASSHGYTSNASRFRYSIFGRYNFSCIHERLFLSFESRQEVVGGKAVPFVFSLGSKYQIIPALSLKGVFARHFAIPIFDDLYWKEDGFARGNPDLRPEYGWNCETGFEYTLKKGPFSFNNEATFFFHKTYDQIVWTLLASQDGENSKWEPLNVDKSVSKGLEYMGNVQMDFPNSTIQIHYLYSYTNARIYTLTITGYDSRPRSYVPQHNATLGLKYTFKGINISYTQSYIGKNHYDDSHTLNSYWLGNIYAGYGLICKRVCIDTYLRIQNLLNTSYQVMKGYAQPPRNFTMGINFKF